MSVPAWIVLQIRRLVNALSRWLGKISKLPNFRPPTNYVL